MAIAALLPSTISGSHLRHIQTVQTVKVFRNGKFMAELVQVHNSGINDSPGFITIEDHREFSSMFSMFAAVFLLFSVAYLIINGQGSSEEEEEVSGIKSPQCNEGYEQMKQPLIQN